MNQFISLRNITKSIDKHYVLHNVSLNIDKGEVYGLIGRNGAGKTTLMKIICGLIQQSSGRVDFPHATCLRCGVLIEEPAAYGWLSGLTNLKIIARMYENVSDSYINYIINLVGLKDHIHKKYDTYSVGMKRRLGIAIALLNKPDLLLLDEPTNGLDYQGVHEIRSLISTLSNEFHCTIIVSSHILADMDKICHRAAFIDNGKILEIVDKATIDECGLEQKYIELIGVNGDIT